LAYIKTINQADATGDLGSIYAKLAGKRGKIAAVHEAQSLNPQVLSQHMSLYVGTMFGESPLSRAEREMLAIIVSASNQCSYCIEHHAHALLHYWKCRERVASLRDGSFKHHLNEREFALCVFAQELTRTPAAASGSKHIQMLRDTGLNDREILDAVGVISYFNYVNRIVLGLGVHLEADGGDGFKY